MKAARVILIALLLLPGGCKRKSQDLNASLHSAVGTPDLKRARALITRGADVNAKDGYYGWAPLHVAAKVGQPGMVSLLITCGADLHLNDGQFGTPLHYAAWEGHAAIVAKLVAAGAKVNVRGIRYGSTPLRLAFARQHIEVAKSLLAGGADPNARDEWGRAVLHDAALKGLTDFAKLLLAHGAEINVKDTEGLTPLHEAMWGSHLEMAQLLLAHGADANAKDGRGQTALHVAAINGYKELFDLLMKEEADVNVKDDQGRTPLDYTRVPAASWVVILRADGKNPYCVILTNPNTVREFLRRESILYDQVWTPGREDIEALNLRDAVEKSTHIATKTWFDLDYILSHLPGYSSEYGGFIRQGKRYVLCNMEFNPHNREPGDQFTWGAEGGCTLARVVIDITDKTVVRIDCNGN